MTSWIDDYRASLATVTPRQATAEDVRAAVDAGIRAMRPARKTAKPAAKPASK